MLYSFMIGNITYLDSYILILKIKNTRVSCNLNTTIIIKKTILNSYYSFF